MKFVPLALEELAQEGRRRAPCVLYKLNGLWNVAKGQDLIEYALMAGFVAVSAGAIMPDVADSISTIFSKVSSVLFRASGQHTS
jgi:Flp pilus assembly pilin Flp